MDRLEEWNRFWNEVPGQEYRHDETPAFLYMSRSLSEPDFRLVSEALASDLEELARKHVALGFIFTLREKLDKQIERAVLYRDDPRTTPKSIGGFRDCRIRFTAFARPCAIIVCTRRIETGRRLRQAVIPRFGEAAGTADGQACPIEMPDVADAVAAGGGPAVGAFFHEHGRDRAWRDPESGPYHRKRQLEQVGEPGEAEPEMARKTAMVSRFGEALR